MSLREHRRRQLLSIRDLAERAGVATQTIVNIEQGYRPPRLSTMRRLCDALNVSPDEVQEFVETIADDRETC